MHSCHCHLFLQGELSDEDRCYGVFVFVLSAPLPLCPQRTSYCINREFHLEEYCLKRTFHFFSLLSDCTTFTLPIEGTYVRCYR